MKNNLMMASVLALSTGASAANVSEHWTGEGQVSFGPSDYLATYDCPAVSFENRISDDAVVLTQNFGTCFDKNDGYLTLPPETYHFEVKAKRLYLDDVQVGFIKDDVMLVNLVGAKTVASFTYRKFDSKLKYTYAQVTTGSGTQVNETAILKRSP